MCKDTPTKTQYLSLQNAYSLMNKKLFEDKLPACFITFQRQKKSYGYYWHNKLAGRKDDSKISEIALAINQFGGQTDKDILSTLLHEMVHHWQACFGKSSRNGYHNAEWGIEMKRVGLHPSSTGEEGGKETGQRVSHYIITGGLFDLLYAELAKKHVTIDWQSRDETAEGKKSKGSKVKYTCPLCQANAWGKPDLKLYCGDCSDTEDTVIMVAETGEDE